MYSSIHSFFEKYDILTKSPYKVQPMLARSPGSRFRTGCDGKSKSIPAQYSGKVRRLPRAEIYPSDIKVAASIGPKQNGDL